MAVETDGVSSTEDVDWTLALSSSLPIMEVKGLQVLAFEGAYRAFCYPCHVFNDSRKVEIVSDDRGWRWRGDSVDYPGPAAHEVNLKEFLESFALEDCRWVLEVYGCRIFTCCQGYRIVSIVDGMVFWEARVGWGWERIAIRFLGPLSTRPALTISSAHSQALRLFGMLVLMHHSLPRHGALLIHAAGALIQGKMVVVAGRSGRGKSTTCRQLLPFSEITVVNDDRIVIRQVADGWVAHGTPWAGELRITRNIEAPLGAVCLLEQSPVSYVERLSPQEALPGLLEVVAIPFYDRAVADLGLTVVGRLLEGVPVFRLHARPDQSLACVLMELAGSL